MRHSALVSLALAVPCLITGCMRQTSSTFIQPDATAVSVRFVVPQGDERMTESAWDTETKLVVDATYDGFALGNAAYRETLSKMDAAHIVLWGGVFDGDDVTRHATGLTPGSYMFAFFDPDESTMVQGWIEVNGGENDIVDILQGWKSELPTHKRKLAYNLEIHGRVGTQNQGMFEGFAEQLHAVDRLGHRIDEAMAAELEARNVRRRQVASFLQGADVLLMPGQERVFRSTTLAAFNHDDIEKLRAGEVMTKIVLVADYEDAKWKLRHVNRLYEDLGRYKAVLRQMLDRFERRKGLFLLTDHLHNHDSRFVENERRLQQVLGYMERMDEHEKELRDRRMALAFMTELVAPDGDFRALDEEEAALRRNRAVFEVEKRRLDKLFEGSEESSAKRVAFERSRQRAFEALAVIDNQLENLREARKALTSMTASTSIIHRQGDKRLLAATFVREDLPFRVRDAIERESLMTIRLQSSESVFVPTGPTITTAAPTFGYQAVPATEAFQAQRSSGYGTVTPDPATRFAQEASPAAGAPASAAYESMEAGTDRQRMIFAMESAPQQQETQTAPRSGGPSVGEEAMEPTGIWAREAKVRKEPRTSRPRQTTDRVTEATWEKEPPRSRARARTPETDDSYTAGRTNAPPAGTWGTETRVVENPRSSLPREPSPTESSRSTGRYARESSRHDATRNPSRTDRSISIARADTEPSGTWVREAKVTTKPRGSVAREDRGRPVTGWGASQQREIFRGQAVRVSDSDNWQGTEPGRDKTTTRRTELTGRSASGTYQTQTAQSDCPLLIKLLVPPCWFVAPDTVGAGAAGAGTVGANARPVSNRGASRVSRSDGSRGTAKDGARLARMKFAVNDGQGSSTYRAEAGENDNDCPLLLRLLVPPCWFANGDQ